MRHLIISDAHGDFEALERVQDKAQKYDFEDIWYLGDAIGYCFTEEAIKCYDWLQKNNSVNILGNWEWWILTPEFDPDNAEAVQKDVSRLKRLDDIQLYRRELPKEYLEIIKTWPEFRIFDQIDATVYHGNPYLDKTLGIIHSSTSYLEEAVDNDRIYNHKIIKTTLLFVGHSHIPACIPWNGRMNHAALSGITEEDMPYKIKKPKVGYHRTNLVGSVGKHARNGSSPCAVIFDDSDFSTLYFSAR